MKVKKIQKRNAKSIKGITLIALVITIVVLLILAAVSITAVFGDNGLLQMAKDAADKTNEAVKSELQDIQSITTDINTLMNNWDTSKVSAVTSADGKTVPVPKGFVGSEATGENTVSGGFVIYEGTTPVTDKNVAEAREERNQFVWVPCTVEQYKRHKYDEVDDRNGEVLNDEGWPSISYVGFKDWQDGTDLERNKESIKKYGGFYIGRYEAGVSTNADFYVSKNNISTVDYSIDKDKNADELKPVSKKGAQGWNCISPEKAIMVSENMYKENTYGIISSLVDNYAWDTTVEWISNSGKYPNILTDSTNYGNYANNSSIEVNNALYAEHLRKYVGETDKNWCEAKKYKYGNFVTGSSDSWQQGTEEEFYKYSTDPIYTYKHFIEMSTGASENSRLNNIYDMAGNFYEWTTEYGYHEVEGDNPTKYVVHRGGAFLVNGTNSTISSINGNNGRVVVGRATLG